jgi:hypothetical protein
MTEALRFHSSVEAAGTEFSWELRKLPFALSLSKRICGKALNNQGVRQAQPERIGRLRHFLKRFTQYPCGFSAIFA